MQTVRLQVDDSKLDTFLTLIENLKDGIVQNVTVNPSDDLNCEDQIVVDGEQFKKDKIYYNKCLEDIQNGKTKILSHDEVWSSIDSHTQVF